MDKIKRIQATAKENAVQSIYLLAKSLLAEDAKDCLLADYYKREAARRATEAVVATGFVKVFTPQDSPHLN